MKSGRGLRLVALMALAMLLAACGGSSDGAGAGGSESIYDETGTYLFDEGISPIELWVQSITLSAGGVATLDTGGETDTGTYAEQYNGVVRLDFYGGELRLYALPVPGIALFVVYPDTWDSELGTYPDHLVGLRTGGTCAGVAAGQKFNGIATPQMQFDVNSNEAWYQGAFGLNAGKLDFDAAGWFATNSGADEPAGQITLSDAQCSGATLTLQDYDQETTVDFLYTPGGFVLAGAGGDGGALMFPSDTAVSEAGIESAVRSYTGVAFGSNGDNEEYLTFVEATGNGSDLLGLAMAGPTPGVGAGDPASLDLLRTSGAGEPFAGLYDLGTFGGDGDLRMMARQLSGGKLVLIGIGVPTDPGPADWTVLVLAEQ